MGQKCLYFVMFLKRFVDISVHLLLMRLLTKTDSQINIPLSSSGFSLLVVFTD